MAQEPDPQMALIFSFYEGVQRKGPGSEASTLKALSMLDELPPSPRIVDFGCGAGAASLVLAKRGRVTAVDIHQPFLDQLNALAAREGLGDCIETIQGDLVAPPFPDESFDLVWSEGAIYFAGFEQGLERWRRLLPTGGFVAVTEATWLCETPSPKAVDFWMTEYPAITSIEDNVGKLHSAGFDPIGHFVLPTEDWENYFGPLAEQLARFRSEKADCAEAQSFADSVQREIDLWQECGGSYGYVFYLGRAV